jgi:hypothetical protein
LSIEDQDFHAGDVSEHPVEVITNRTHEHHRFLPFSVLPFSNPCNNEDEEEAEEWRRRRDPGSRKFYFRDGFLTIPSMFVLAGRLFLFHNRRVGFEEENWVLIKSSI